MDRRRIILSTASIDGNLRQHRIGRIDFNGLIGVVPCGTIILARNLLRKGHF